jgi:hypothetical protein
MLQPISVQYALQNAADGQRALQAEEHRTRQATRRSAHGQRGQSPRAATATGSVKA